MWSRVALHWCGKYDDQQMLMSSRLMYTEMPTQQVQGGLEDWGIVD